MTDQEYSRLCRDFEIEEDSIVGQRLKNIFAQYDTVVKNFRTEGQELVKLVQILAAIVRGNVAHKPFGEILDGLHKIIEKNGIPWNKYSNLLFSMPSQEIQPNMERDDIEKRLHMIEGE